MINRLPVWFRQELPDQKVSEKLNLLSEFKVHTVCREAKCPNLSRCFKQGELTFLILGDTCTRACRFCAVKKSQGRRLALDDDEPRRISEIVKLLALRYVVITSVTRDDLSDGGAGVFAKSARLIKAIDKKIKVELLIPDFCGNSGAIETIVDSLPAVIAHNLETVKRLYPELRPRSDYQLSLNILKQVKERNPGLATKSSLILGLGEIEEEVIAVMRDLRQVHCDILTLGQYLTPSYGHYPVKEFLAPQSFKRYEYIGKELGFAAVLSGPKVRSSYQAEKIYACV